MTFSDFVIDPIAEGVDLVIRFGDLENCDGLIARKLATYKLVTCASPAYLEDRGAPASPDDLRIYRALPTFTTSCRASIVSSIGVAGSHRCI